MQCWGHALPKHSLACTGLSLPTLSCERERDPVTVGVRMLPCSGPGLCTFSLVYAASSTLTGAAGLYPEGLHRADTFKPPDAPPPPGRDAQSDLCVCVCERVQV